MLTDEISARKIHTTRDTSPSSYLNIATADRRPTRASCRYFSSRCNRWAASLPRRTAHPCQHSVPLTVSLQLLTGKVLSICSSSATSLSVRPVIAGRQTVSIWRSSPSRESGGTLVTYKDFILWYLCDLILWISHREWSLFYHLTASRTVEY